MKALGGVPANTALGSASRGASSESGSVAAHAA